MRYFKWEQVNAEQMAVFREKHARLLAEEAHAARREKGWRRLGTAVFATVSLVCLVGVGMLLWRLPQRESLFEQILQVVGQVALTLLLIPVGLVLGALASSPLFARAERGHKAQRQAVLAAACQGMREHYGFCEPCLVTKCYRCDDKRFTDHDVCLFFVGEELRLTTNLRQGFIRESKDLGCYAFAPGELTVREEEHNGRRATLLVAGEGTFLLGARAKRFIEAGPKISE